MKLRILFFISLLFIPLHVSAVTFTDTANSEFKEFIDFLSNKNIINGYSDGTFKPDNNITNAEALKIIYESAESAHVEGVSVDYTSDLSNYITQAKEDFPDMNLEKDGFAIRGNLMYFSMILSRAVYPESSIYLTDDNPFTDVQKTDPRYDAIAGGYYMGFVRGYPDKTFQPERNITRGEFTKIIFNVFFNENSPLGACYRSGGFYGEGGTSSWAACYHYFDDGGKTCNDSRDCKGACITEDTTATVGKCQEKDPTFGCYGERVYDEISGQVDVQGICLD